MWFISAIFCRIASVLVIFSLLFFLSLSLPVSPPSDSFSFSPHYFHFCICFGASKFKECRQTDSLRAIKYNRACSSQLWCCGVVVLWTQTRIRKVVGSNPRPNFFSCSSTIQGLLFHCSLSSYTNMSTDYRLHSRAGWSSCNHKYYNQR